MNVHATQAKYFPLLIYLTNELFLISFSEAYN